MHKKIITFTILLAAMVWGMTANAQNGPFGFGLQVASNVNKVGLGAKFSYDFTKMCRFTVDGTYYLYNTSKGKTVYETTGGSFWDATHYISSNTPSYTVYGGRQFDVNANLNIVFGERDFHFYLLTGLAFAYGRPALNGAFSAHDHTDEFGNRMEYGIDADQVHNVFGIGLNLGCGIEYQITDAIRANFEQMLDISLPNLTAWMAKLGVSYCF